jgi:hypothetical protein
MKASVDFTSSLFFNSHLVPQIVTEEELKEHQRATIVGGAKGFLGGLAVALPASAFAQRRSPYYRSLPLSIKALGVVSVVVPAFVITAEQAGHAFERQQWWAPVLKFKVRRVRSSLFVGLELGSKSWTPRNLPSSAIGSH